MKFNIGNGAMKKIKIVYITSHQLSQRWLNAFCLDTIAEQYDIEYWDSSDIIYPRFKTINTIERPWVKAIGTFKQFKKELQALPVDSLIVCTFGLDDNPNIIKTISQKYKNIIFVDFWSTDANSTCTNLSCQNNTSANTEQAPITCRKKLKHIIYQSLFIRRCAKSMASFIRNLHNAPFTSAIQEWKTLKLRETRQENMRQISQLCNIIYISTRVGSAYYINHTDYEKYLSLANSPRLYKTKYIVYADCGFPNLADYTQFMNEYEKKSISEKFYKSLRLFFDKVEKQYQLNIIVASHPGATHPEGAFGNREIVLYKTPELIKDCEFIVTLGGCFLSYAAFWNKSFTLITNGAVRNHKRMKDDVEAYGIAFKKDLCDTDTCNDIKEFVQPLSEDVRTRYINNAFDMSISMPNSELYVKHFDDIYKSIYEK